MAAVRHLGFLKYKFLNGQGVYDTHFASSYQISQRSVKPLWRYRDFCDFQDGGRRRLGFLKIPNFNGQSAIRGQYASPCQILLKSVKRLQIYCDLTIWFDPSAILDLLVEYWDHPRWPLGGLYRCAKFGWNRCSSFDNMNFRYFARLAWKRLFTSQKLGFGGISPRKWGAVSTKLPKGTHLH